MLSASRPAVTGVSLNQIELEAQNSMEFPLNVPAPRSFAYVKRNIPQVTVEQRERALRSTHYNEFAFPAGMLTVDMLSDSGTTAMTDLQWSALMLGDESYGRNKGYYVLLDAMRDVFERGDDQKHTLDLVRTGCEDIEKLMDQLYLVEYEGGLFNGGAAQMERPNTFLVPQGRCAESLLFSTAISIPPRGTSSRWAPSPGTCTTRTSSGRCPRAANTSGTPSRGTWTWRSSSR